MISIFLDDKVKNVTLSSMAYSDTSFSEDVLIQHLQEPPKFTVVRVNTELCDRHLLRDILKNYLLIQYKSKGAPCPSVDFHPEIKDALVVKSNYTPRNVESIYPKVVVGLQCGVAVLRGSHVYAPGVTAIPYGLSIGDKVSVYADLEGKCKRGWSQEYLGSTVFVGNGILVLNRKDLFTTAIPKGLAVNMIDTLYDCPSIGDILEENARVSGLQKGFLQNLPSILCGHALKPLEQHAILDMCAAPGGKTTHIAALLHGKGDVIAIDKSAPKIKQIQENAMKLGLQNIRTFVFDSVKAVKMAEDGHKEEMLLAPPYLPESFDRICLDAPCSALGQRPQLYNPIRLKELESFPRLQRKLFTAAVELLKVGGRMVYSTCTYNIAENEGIVSWALKKFPCLLVVPADIQIGKPGYEIEGLNYEQCCAMQRFGSLPAETDMTDENNDTIGFFFCCFEKKAQ